MAGLGANMSKSIRMKDEKFMADNFNPEGVEGYTAY